MSEIKNENLQKAFLKCLDRLEKACNIFPWDNRHAYGNWLAQTYYFVRHTTSFLGLASSRFGHWQRDRQYHLFDHLREELNHDKIVLDDLKNLGFTLEDFPELPETSAFYQAQYYYIEHENPVAHFGYSLCLEGLAAKKLDPIYKIVEETFSESACRFLHLHCVVDKDHFDQGLKDFNDMTPLEANFILKNLEQSCSLYILILEHAKRIAMGQIPEAFKNVA
jgi:hypothetical protein